LTPNGSCIASTSKFNDKKLLNQAVPVRPAVIVKYVFIF